MPESMVWICPFCNTPNPEGYATCHKCGKPCPDKKSTGPVQTVVDSYGKCGVKLQEEDPTDA